MYILSYLVSYLVDRVYWQTKNDGNRDFMNDDEISINDFLFYLLTYMMSYRTLLILIFDVFYAQLTERRRETREIISR